MFNELALFGKEYRENGSQDQETSFDLLATIFPSKKLLPERYNIPIEYLIQLFAQSIILLTFISRNFPYNPVKTQIKSIIEQHIILFCNKKSFSSSRNTDIVRELLDHIIKNI